MIYEYQKQITSEDQNGDLEASFIEDLQSRFEAQYQKINNFYVQKRQQYSSDLETVFYNIYNIQRISTLADGEAKRLLSLDEKDDAVNIAASLQRAFSDVHKKIW